jgi:hypothetical protein
LQITFSLSKTSIYAPVGSFKIFNVIILNTGGKPSVLYSH